MKKLLLLSLSLCVMAGFALLGSSADSVDSFPKYEAVADGLTMPPAASFGSVTGVATDASDRLYVFHRGKKPLMVFDKAGKFVRSWGDDLIDTAHGLRVDRDGNVWTTDVGHHLVIKFDPQGKVLLTLGKKDDPGDGQNQFDEPTDVAFAPGGEFLYVADGYGNSRVVKFTKAGKYVKEWGKKGTGAGEFDLPHTICTDSKGQVYVGDRENKRVQVFDADGKFLAQWQQSGVPYGLFLTGNRMLLADGVANSLNVLNLEGKVLRRLGEKGVGIGRFNLPHAVCVDSRGIVYVADSDNQAVRKYVPK